MRISEPSVVLQVRRLPNKNASGSELEPNLRPRTEAKAPIARFSECGSTGRVVHSCYSCIQRLCRPRALISCVAPDADPRMANDARGTTAFVADGRAPKNMHMPLCSVLRAATKFLSRIEND
jgi:hypothetical protein